MSVPKSERSANARRAALTRAANEIGAEISAPAREAYLASFAPAPRPGLSAAEAERMRQAAIKLRMAELGRLSGLARRRASQAAEAAEAAAALAVRALDEAV